MIALRYFRIPIRHDIWFASALLSSRYIDPKSDYRHSSGYRESHIHQKGSFFRGLLGLTVVVGGTSAVIYFSKTTRDYIGEYFPSSKRYYSKIDQLVDDLIKQFSGQSFIRQKSQILDLSDSHLPDHISPSFPSVEDVSKVVDDKPKFVFNEKPNLSNVIAKAESDVKQAIEDMRKLTSATTLYLNDLQGTKASKWSSVLDSSDPQTAQNVAVQSHRAAQQSLADLRSTINSLKVNTSEGELEIVERAIHCYGDLAYELSGMVNEIRKLQNQVAVFKDFKQNGLSQKDRLQNEVASIIPEQDRSGASGESGLTEQELNSLVSMALNRIDQLYKNLEAYETESRQRLNGAINSYRNVSEVLIKEAVDRELARERVQNEVERLRWEQKARTNTDRELEQALTRHGQHLSQMLRIKQDEMEHQFKYRLREAMIEQRKANEADLHKWIGRMKAIEHVVEGRADIDRVAKATQELWLAAEALAAVLTRGDSGLQNTTGPLRGLVEGVKKIADTQRHHFVLELIKQIPEDALNNGVWTRQGLLNRFDKVYKVSRNVALIDETGASLGGYLMSWLQSRLVFDAVRYSRLFSSSRAPALLTPDSEVTERPDTFCLLASARAALLAPRSRRLPLSTPDTSICNDLHFAVRLIGQLSGQSALVAVDWLRDARTFLEVHQIVQALLAYASATNISTFDQRL